VAHPWQHGCVGPSRSLGVTLAVVKWQLTVAGLPLEGLCVLQSSCVLCLLAAVCRPQIVEAVSNIRDTWDGPAAVSDMLD
jgi:hypothetical protein